MKNNIYLKLLKNQKNIFKELKKIRTSHPYFCIIFLHEYYRNLYPYDPNIKFKIADPIKRIIKLQYNIINAIKSLKTLGYYRTKFDNLKNRLEFKAKTGKVYGNIWFRFSNKENLKSKKVILERLKSFKTFKKSFLKGKQVIDVGCGGGRYTNALRSLGAKSVTGVDYGVDGIKLAKKKYPYKNLKFIKQNVLKLKFRDNKFDFVFSNGVIHHTNNFTKGIKELVRVCKPGGYIYLYLYGIGGLFWSARREMNNFMKKIPQSYTQEILNKIGMPSNRFIFIDNWYVPRERHCSHKEVYRLLKSMKVNKIEKMIGGAIKTDLETGLKKYKNSKVIWGEGEIRLLIKK